MDFLSNQTRMNFPRNRMGAATVEAKKNPRLIPKKIHLPFDFRENSSLFDFGESSCKTPQKKLLFLFAPYAFWICSRGLHPPFDFQENSSSFDCREKPCKTLKENQKICFFVFAPCAFWICSHHHAAAPIQFTRKFILVWFQRKFMQNPQGKPIKLLFCFCSLRFLDLFLPPCHRPHSISWKIHPHLVSEKIHAKPPRKTKKFAFFLAPCAL